MKQIFTVTGMACAACSARVEKTVSAIPCITEASVNLLTGKMTVIFDDRLDTSETDKLIITEVEKAGYHAVLNSSSETAVSQQTEASALSNDFRLLIVSVFCILVLAYITMGQMLGFPVPFFVSSSINPVSYALIQMMLALSIIALNRKYYINGFRNLFKRSPNMDTLISLGSSISFIYSLAMTVLIIRLYNSGDYITASEKSGGLFFESAGMIPVFISIGKYLEEKAKFRTADSLRSLIKLKPDNAIKFDESSGSEEKIPISKIQPGDILCVRAGEGIPCDGQIIFGEGSIDEAMLTGESIPVDKAVQDNVYEATINRQGYFRMKAEKTGEETVFSQIISLVEDVSGSKAPIQRLADKISLYFVPIVLILSAITFSCWLIAGKDISFAITMGVSVMVISCPCSLGLATPTAIMAATGRGAEMKILVKSAEALETLHKCDTVFLDKTGTITTGELAVTDVYTEDVAGQKEFLLLASKLEAMSSHPIAAAIASYPEKNSIKTENTVLTDEIPFGFSERAGKGLIFETDKNIYLAGNQKLLKEYSNGQALNKTITEKYEEFGRQGKTSVIFAKIVKASGAENKKDNEILGIIAVQDTIKHDAKETIGRLKRMNIKACMLTGDNSQVAEAIAEKAGITSYYSELTPEQKLEKIRELQSQGKRVAMAGDGINDAPALLTADVGIAIGSGTDVAIGSADIVILGNTLSPIASAYGLSKAAIRNIKQNLFWALFYNCLAIPVAAGVFYPFFGLKLNPMIAAACMSVSSLFVVTNAIRLRFFKKN